MKKRSKKKRLKRKLRKATKELHRLRKAQSQVLPTANIPDAPVHAEAGLPSLEDQDDPALARAKRQWFFGEWEELIQVDREVLHGHPRRDRLALLVASAHQQLGDTQEARRYSRLALEWGCPPRILAQVLISGVHNTLGCAAALKGDDARRSRHFEAAIGAVGMQDPELLVHARSVREMARLGLLSQAMSLVERQLENSSNVMDRRRQEAGQTVLRTEVELLRHELSLAQRRGQLNIGRAEGRRSDDVATLSAPSMSREALERLSMSQLGQDLWVLEQVGYKKNGFFVEFGATDGVLLSNTWLLEKYFLWKGICAEPNPAFTTLLRENRSCIVSDACVGAKTGERVEFVLADAFGGMARYQSDDDHAEKRQAYADMGKTAVFETVSLDDLLQRSGAPVDIDYISIDTEGSELEIIETFPFNKWNVRLFTIEHNYTERRADIRRLMASHGYRCVEAQFDDWFFRGAG